MTSISPRTSGGPVTDDPSWIGSGHGTDTNKTVTLDISKFDAETHYPNGFLPSGLPLGKITATGLYGPYDAAVDPADGTENLDCFLYSPLTVESGVTAVSGAGFTHGPIVEANLPIEVDAGGKADVAARIWFE